MKKTLIIAEAGVNHNGQISLAKRLVDVAAEAGADYVKFQIFKANNLVTIDAKKALYQLRNKDDDDTQYLMLKKLELSDEEYIEIYEYCKKKDIGFMASGFDIQGIKFLIELGCDYLKIPSGEITNLPYLKYVANQGVSVILSTGMSTIQEIESAIVALYKSGLSSEKLTLLHCTSEYPAPLDTVNLKVIERLKDTFKVKVGYSDHTVGVTVSLAAVALGADIIEKHFTLDKNMDGPDHNMSLCPEELNQLVRGIRDIEISMGNGTKKPTPMELKNALHVRKSLVASKYISKGEVFSENNITSKRPGNGISPMHIDQIIGKIATRSFNIDDLIII